jgi:hypothetical protein
MRGSTWVFFFLLASASSVLDPALFAQQPQAQSGQPVYAVNAKYVNGVAPGYWPTKGSGLTLNLSAGTALCGVPPAAVTYAGGTLSMTATATNYVYLDPAASCAPASNTSGFKLGQIQIAQVVAAGSISSITDLRGWFLPGPIGTDSNGAALRQEGTSSSRVGASLPTVPTLQLRRYGTDSPLVVDSEEIGDSGAQPGFSVINDFNGSSTKTGKPWGAYFLSSPKNLTIGTAVGVFGGVRIDATTTAPGWGGNSICLSYSATANCYGWESDTENESENDMVLHSGPIMASFYAASVDPGATAKKASAYFFGSSDGAVPVLEGIHLEDMSQLGIHLASPVSRPGHNNLPVTFMLIDPYALASGTPGASAPYFQMDVSNYNGGSPVTNGMRFNVTPLTDTTWAFNLQSGTATPTGLSAPSNLFRIANDGSVSFFGSLGTTTISSNGKLTLPSSVSSAVNAVGFSASPAFDASLGNTQKITLTGNVTSSTLSNATAGEQINFIICQDSAGSHTFVWPSNVKGGMTIGSTLSTCSAQSFIFDGSKAYALGQGSTNM